MGQDGSLSVDLIFKAREYSDSGSFMKRGAIQLMTCFMEHDCRI